MLDNNIRTLLCIVKEPGWPSRFERCEDRLRAWDQLVDGMTEAEMLGTQLAVIYDRYSEEADKPYNCTLGGKEYFGTVAVVGVWKETFASLPIDKAEAIRCALFGRERKVV